MPNEPSEGTPSPMPDRGNGEVSARELLDMARALENRIIPALQDDIQTLKKANKRNRQGLYALSAGGVILLGVVIGVIVALVAVDHATDKARDAANKATTVQEYQSNACLAGNEQRTAQRELWAYIIDFEVEAAEKSGENIPQADLDAVEELRAYVNKSFANRDCSRVLTGGQQGATSPTPAAAPGPRAR